MTREEFKAYGVKLREKTHVYKRMKNELAEFRGELVVLHRTEQILRGRDQVRTPTHAHAHVRTCALRIFSAHTVLPHILTFA